MKFRSIANPFTRKGHHQQQQLGGDGERVVQQTDTNGNTNEERILSLHANDQHESPLSPPVPLGRRHGHLNTRSNSTPPSATAITDRLGHASVITRKSTDHPSTTNTTRKPILRSPSSHTPLNHRSLPSSPQSPAASTSTLTSAVRSDPSEVPLTSSNNIMFSDSAISPTHQQQQQRKRRKSFKDIFSLSSNKVSHDQSAGKEPLFPSSEASSDLQARTRRFSLASSPLAASPPSNSPTSPGIRKSLFSVSVRDLSSHHHQQSANIPPVPRIPAHLSPIAASPVSPESLAYKRNSLYITAPQTPTSATHQYNIPGSAHSATSTSSTHSSNNGALSKSKSLSQIMKSPSPSVPALYTPAAFNDSPASSTSTLATPQTVELRNTTRLSPKEDMTKMKKEQLSPLLLGPCLSETLLNPAGPHGSTNEDVVEAFAPRSEVRQSKGDTEASEDGYGSESAEGRLSLDSDDYGAASNLSHALQSDENDGETGRESSNTPHLDHQTAIVETSLAAKNAMSRRNSASAGSNLRVDTSLAAASAMSRPPEGIKRQTTAHVTTSPASLSPYAQSFPSHALYRPQDTYARSASSSTSEFRRTPTPTLRTVDNARTPSPRSLSQGAKICLDYTIYRLKRDGSASSSTQAEKVNMLSSGGRRYPSSTRPCNIVSPSAQLQHADAQHLQLRKEPKNANIARELAYITIMKKLHSRKRLTLMEEVELDGFKRIQSTWTPCSTPLQAEFTLSPPQSDASSKNANASGATALLSDGPLSKSSSQPPMVDANRKTTSTSVKMAMATVANEDSKVNTSTSAFVSGAFMTAQQLAWRNWINRMSFQESKICVLQDGETVSLVQPSDKSRTDRTVHLSDRVLAWTKALSDEPHDNKTAPLHAGAAGLVSSAAPSRPVTILSATTLSSNQPQMDTEMPPFTKNRMPVFGRRSPSAISDDQTGATSNNNSTTIIGTAKEVAPVIGGEKAVGNGKSSFGSTLASKLGFRSGKKKMSPTSTIPAEKTHYAVAVPAKAPTRAEEGSSASSLATTITPKSTPTTSASSACSDQTDIDTTLKGQDSARPSRSEGSNLRPPREAMPRPSSMVRSATTQALLSQAKQARPASMLVDGNTRTPDGQPAKRNEAVPLAQTQSVVPKSHTDQRLSTYQQHLPNAVLPTTDTRVSLVDSPPLPEKPQRRVRVVSQPAGSMHSRPHSMYSAAHTRERSGTSTASSSRRPPSQLLQVPRSSSMYIPTSTHADAAKGRDDDDDMPLAALRQGVLSPSNASGAPKSRDGASTPEARPRLRSAMRSASQPRPSSMYNATSNRLSIVSQQGQPPMPRPHSFANNRLSTYDLPSLSGGSAGNREDSLRTQIREEQLKKEREEEELRRRREQRKIWEDHRRRSVYLDEKAAAAEKAANEANRRQSQLYMSMALAQPAFSPSFPYTQTAPYDIYNTQVSYGRRAG
ncbi:hypothetical protein P389DRAFT_211395 [Cystobasidium minutum MCA 4210]|uniref:uncharacterized protein n=1 Tax=Cystobasidium minutum MCA 4210 TaxID=1397322 RepID=UPI0034CD5DB5|eukprot:jgi/Rhomi1/211395/estExt_Genemark1.C_4_t30072